MVWCRTHNRTHKGRAAKMACMMSIMNNKTFDEAFDIVKKGAGTVFVRNVGYVWEHFNEVKEQAELMIEKDTVNNGTIRDEEERRKVVKVACRGVMDEIRKTKAVGF